MNILIFLAKWDIADVLLLLGIIVIIFTILIARRKSKSDLRQYSEELRKLGQGDIYSSKTNTDEEKLRSSVEELFNQVQSYSHDVIQRIDTKMRMLNMLIIDADKKITELKQLMEKSKIQQTTILKQSNSTSETYSKPDEKINQQQTFSFDEIKSVKTEETSKDTIDVNSSSKVTNIYDDVYSLSDTGFSIEEIARKLNLPEGEVKLIIGMRKVD